MTTTATEIMNFGAPNRPDCAICADPADWHGLYEITTGPYKGFMFHCAAIDEGEHVCNCEGYEPMIVAEEDGPSADPDWDGGLGSLKEYDR